MSSLFIPVHPLAPRRNARHGSDQVWNVELPERRKDCELARPREVEHRLGVGNGNAAIVCVTRHSFPRSRLSRRTLAPCCSSGAVNAGLQ